LSRASAIPPLRHVWTSAAAREECSKWRGNTCGLEHVADALFCEPGGGKPRFNHVTGQTPPLRQRSRDGGSRRDAAPTEGRNGARRDSSALWASE